MKMQRRRFKQVEDLHTRLIDHAKRLRVKAAGLKPGAARAELLRKARECETGMQMSEWLRSPGMHPPE